jgi:hypothetical protein
VDHWFEEVPRGRHRYMHGLVKGPRQLVHNATRCCSLNLVVPHMIAGLSAHHMGHTAGC